MYIMSLLMQPDKGAAHGNNVIVGMRAENDHPLPGGFGPFRPVRIVCIGFSARPTGNGVLQLIENLNFNIIGMPVNGQQIAEHVIVILLVDRKSTSMNSSH